ncbi:MAG: Smr/MutS family protein [Gammaproteobacteria bacterium]
MSRHPDKPPARTPVPEPADHELFQASVGPVKPLAHDRVELPRSRPPPRARFRERDEQKILRDALSDEFDPAGFETGEELGFARRGLQARTLKRLRRGQLTQQAECDLHGLTASEARQALGAFLDACLARGLRCVRVIHGKGLGSQQRIPVLKRKIGGWLCQCDEVLAFCSARPVDGGTGAVYVLLKKI